MTTEDLPLRRLAVCASGLVYWGGVMLQARRIRKQIGRSPNLKPRTSRERALWFGWFLVILVWIGQPLILNVMAAQPALALWPVLLHPVSLALGLTLVVLGYAGTLWTYAAMGNTWRIGVNPNEKTALVCHGPYRWVRHPIYGFQIVMLAGVVLLLPTPVSLATLTVHYLCARLKAADEENYLQRVHGGDYREYMARTGRLFPTWSQRSSTSKDHERP
jgi:protein-S-isoprenylcysteine O-methyltransferase Ste14